MNPFNFKPDNDLTKMLKQSQQDFRFDQEKVKARLDYSLRAVPIWAPSHRFFTIRIVRYSVVTASMLIFVSATFVFASNAKPGEKLFALNKFGEQVLLSLPLTMDQKAQLHTHIVTNRLNALSQIQTADVTSQLERVKESDESIHAAIQAISTNKEKLQTRGQTTSAQKLDKVLNQLDDLAAQHEQRIKIFETTVNDQKTRDKIDARLHEIKKARHKARLELKIDTENED